MSNEPINDPAMTRIDEFAKVALAGILAKLPLVDQTGELGVKVPDKAQYNRDVAESAFEIAVAMETASKKFNNGGSK